MIFWKVLKRYLTKGFKRCIIKMSFGSAPKKALLPRLVGIFSSNFSRVWRRFLEICLGALSICKSQTSKRIVSKRIVNDAPES